jgi:hypothetical protein
LKRKSHCILNKEYSKEEYFKLKEKIISDMNQNPWISKTGHVYKYGEFLPPELSPFGYNETVASEMNPLSKEDAISMGFNWSSADHIKHDATIQSNELPLIINEVGNEILKEAIQCSFCDKVYNISLLEFELLKRFNKPIPHSCPTCRHLRRFSCTNKPKLYDRVCDKCNLGIKTSYSSDRPEIIYCEKCYQEEID